MLFNATFKNISVISWRTVLLVEACSGFFKGQYLRVRVRVMVFNATFMNISFISWQQYFSYIHENKFTNNKSCWLTLDGYMDECLD